MILSWSADANQHPITALTIQVETLIADKKPRCPTAIRTNQKQPLSYKPHLST